MASKEQQQALQAKEKVLQDEITKFRAMQKGKTARVVAVVLYVDSSAVMCFYWNTSVDIQKCMTSSKQLDAQLTENKNVKDVSCWNYIMRMSSSIQYPSLVPRPHPPLGTRLSIPKRI